MDEVIKIDLFDIQRSIKVQNNNFYISKNQLSINGLMFFIISNKNIREYKLKRVL